MTSQTSSIATRGQSDSQSISRQSNALSAVVRDAECLTWSLRGIVMLNATTSTALPDDSGWTNDTTNDANGTSDAYDAVAPSVVDSVSAALYIAGIATSAASVLLTSAAIYLLSRCRQHGRGTGGCGSGSRPYMSLLLNLSVSDLLVALATAGILGSDYMQLGIDAGDYGAAGDAAAAALHRRNSCSRFVIGQIWDVATYENLATLWLMAADHFVAIRFPLRYAMVMRKRHVRVFIAATWLLCAALGCLPLMLVAASYNPYMEAWPEKGTTRFCYQFVVYSHRELFDLSQDWHAQIARGLGAATVTVVFTSIVGTYVYILTVVLKMRLDYAPVLAANANAKAPSSAKMAALAEKKKAILTTLALVSAFCVCYVPMQVFYIMQDGGSGGGGWIRGSGSAPPNYADICFMSLVSCVGIFDPLIYTARTPEVKATIRALRCRKQEEPADGFAPHPGQRRGTVSTMI